MDTMLRPLLGCHGFAHHMPRWDSTRPIRPTLLPLLRRYIYRSLIVKSPRFLSQLSGYSTIHRLTAGISMTPFQPTELIMIGRGKPARFCRFWDMLVWRGWNALFRIQQRTERVARMELKRSYAFSSTPHHTRSLRVRETAQDQEVVAPRMRSSNLWMRGYKLMVTSTRNVH